MLTQQEAKLIAQEVVKLLQANKSTVLPDDQTMSVNEAAAYLHVSPWYLRTELCSVIPYFQRAKHGRIIFLRSNLDNYLKSKA